MGKGIMAEIRYGLGSDFLTSVFPDHRGHNGKLNDWSWCYDQILPCILTIPSHNRPLLLCFLYT
jgi:hypothetical protein